MTITQICNNCLKRLFLVNRHKNHLHHVKHMFFISPLITLVPHHQIYTSTLYTLPRILGLLFDFSLPYKVKKAIRKQFLVYHLLLADYFVHFFLFHTSTNIWYTNFQLSYLSPYVQLFQMDDQGYTMPNSCQLRLTHLYNVASMQLIHDAILTNSHQLCLRHVQKIVNSQTIHHFF